VCVCVEGGGEENDKEVYINLDGEVSPNRPGVYPLGDGTAV
jgi:hypothetical protein